MGNTVRRANLDGSNAEVISYVADPWLIQDLALDSAHGKVYISNWSGGFGSRGNIQRVNLDGSNLEDVVTGRHAEQHSRPTAVNVHAVAQTDTPGI